MQMGDKVYRLGRLSGQEETISWLKRVPGGSAAHSRQRGGGGTLPWVWKGQRKY